MLLGWVTISLLRFVIDRNEFPIETMLLALGLECNECVLEIDNPCFILELSHELCL